MKFISMYTKTEEINDYRQWKKLMEKERLDRLEKKKKRQKAIEELHILKSQVRREQYSNLLRTGNIGPVSGKEIEAYELQQMLMSGMYD